MLAERGKSFGKRRHVEGGRGNPHQEVSGKNGEWKEEPRSQEELHVLPEEEAARLFVSIGRNRKVFPREIIGLLNAKAQVTRDDIGGIRILDNYSFVQVRNDVADTVIRALNGQNYRGKTLTVSYARPKKDDSESPEYGSSGGPEDSENG
jgi:hypothetical protein